MVVQHFILRHWKKQLRIFLGNLALLKKQYQTESVHDLRVSVKKLRAYLRLLRVLDKKFDPGLKFEETEQLFSLFGKHRDIEMGIRLLQKWEQENKVSYTFLCDHLALALQRSGEWIQPALANYDAGAITELTFHLQENLRNHSNGEMRARIGSNIEKDFARSSRHTSQFGRHTHQVRKLFKDILYQAELLQVSELPAKLPVSRIKKILDRLGDWQDHEMLQRKVRHFRKDFIPASRNEFDLLKQLEKDISGKKQQLLDSCEKIFNQQ